MFRPFYWTYDCDTAANQAAAMRADITDAGDHYEVITELPGFAKDEIAITLKDAVLTIRAEKKDQKDTAKYLRNERYHGALERRFQLDKRVTPEDLSAKYEDGLLTVSIAKKDDEHTKTDTTIQIL